jgi:hypothetical protein
VHSNPLDHLVSNLTLCDQGVSTENKICNIINLVCGNDVFFLCVCICVLLKPSSYLFFSTSSTGYTVYNETCNIYLNTQHSHSVVVSTLALHLEGGQDNVLITAFGPLILRIFETCHSNSWHFLFDMLQLDLLSVQIWMIIF